MQDIVTKDNLDSKLYTLSLYVPLEFVLDQKLSQYMVNPK